MYILKKEYRLSEFEQKVVKVLGKYGHLSVTDLAKKLKEPRTTVYTPIQHLAQRGFLSSVKVKKEKLYSLAMDKLGEENNHADHRVAGSFEEIITIFSEQLSRGIHTRLRNIEATGTVLHLMDNLHIDFVKKYSHIITASGVVVESVIEEDYLDECKRVYGSEKYNKFVQSLVGRPYNISFIEKGVLEPHVQVLILEDVFVINWKTKSFYHYKEKEMVGLFTTYFTLLQSKAKKVDINKYFV